MTRTTRVTFVIATTLFLLVAGAAVSAQPAQSGAQPGGQGAGPGGPGGPGGPWGPGHRGAGPLAGILRQLDLTDQQRTQAHEIIRQHLDGSLGQLMHDHFQARRELRSLIVDPAADDNAIVAAVQADTTAAEQLALEQHQMTKDLFGILTDDQKQKATALLAELPDEPGPPRHRHHRGGPPSED